MPYQQSGLSESFDASYTSTTSFILKQDLMYVLQTEQGTEDAICAHQKKVFPSAGISHVI